MLQRIRTRLLLFSFAIILVLGGLGAMALHAFITERATHDAFARLTASAQAAAELLAEAPAEARRLGLTNRDASVRFEPTPALGVTETQTAELLRVTVPVIVDGTPVGSLIATAPPLAIHRAQHELHRWLLIAAVLGLLFAMLMSWAATALVGRNLRHMVDAAREVARGTSRHIRDEIDQDVDELKGLREWFNYLSDDMHRSLDELAKGRAMLASVLESLTQGVIALDSQGKVEVMNDTARAMLGIRSSQLGEGFGQFIDHAELAELARGHAPLTTEVTTDGGKKLLIRREPKRNLGGLVLTVEDVTTIRELENVRREFVANVSHELRTPVAVIRANAETLMAGAKDDPEFATKLIDGLHRNAERLARMLADLLDLSRLDAGQYRLLLTDVSLAAAVNRAIAAVEPITQKNQCTIVVAPELLTGAAMLTADPNALDQVLVNLIDNAVKYGSHPGTVQITASTQDQLIRLEVSDDGPGLPPEHHKRVFERFYRADVARNRAAGGTGLGLAIVKHLVESMGGEVGVEAASPTGTRFWLTLPQALPQ